MIFIHRWIKIIIKHEWGFSSGPKHQHILNLIRMVTLSPKSVSHKDRKQIIKITRARYRYWQGETGGETLMWEVVRVELELFEWNLTTYQVTNISTGNKKKM